MSRGAVRRRSPASARHAPKTCHRPWKRRLRAGQEERQMAAVVPSESQSPASTAWEFGVHSEVGKLRRVMIHRPDLELKRLTPNNHDELLFDDVLWVRRARQQHDAFADLLRERGTEVFYLEDLLAEALRSPEARTWVLDRAVTGFTVGAGVVEDA